MTNKRKENAELPDKISEESQTSYKQSRSIGKISRGIITGSKKLVNVAKEQLDKLKETRKLHKELENHTHEFNVEGTKETFRAFKDPNDNVIFFLTDESRIPRLVKSNTILFRLSDGLRLKVVSVETKNQSEMVLHVNGEDVTLRVHSIYTRSIEDDIVPTVLNNINQSLVISGSTINGGIQQINDLTNKLNEFENQLKSFRPSLINKVTYTEAVKIYGDVKDLIINGKKDSSIVHKFINLLSKIGGPLLTIFSKIIGL